MDASAHYAQLFSTGGVPPTMMCLTWVRLADVDEALVRYDGFPARRRDSVMMLNEWFPPAGASIVVAGPLGDGVLIADPHGWHGTTPAVLERLSAGTVAATVHWTDFASGHLAYAVDGRVTTYLSEGSEQGADPAVAAEFLAGFDGSREGNLVFLERVTGVRLDADWFTSEHPASVVVDPARFREAVHLSALLPGVQDHRWSPDSRGGPPLPDAAQEVFRAAAEERRKALVEAADLAVARVVPPGAAADPLAAARESFRQGVEWFWEEPDEDEEPTGGGLDDYFAEQEAAEDGEAAAKAAMRRAHAWAAVHGWWNDDPREALRVVLTQARQADPEGWPGLQRDVIELLSGSGR